MVIMVPDPENPGEYKSIKEDLTYNPYPFKGDRPIFRPGPVDRPVTPVDKPIYYKPPIAGDRHIFRPGPGDFRPEPVDFRPIKYVPPSTTGDRHIFRPGPVDRPTLTLPKEYWTVQPGTGMKPGAMGGSGGNMVLVKNPEYKPPLPTPPINFKPIDKSPMWTTNSTSRDSLPTPLGKYGGKSKKPKPKSKKNPNKLTKFHGI